MRGEDLQERVVDERRKRMLRVGFGVRWSWNGRRSKMGRRGRERRRRRGESKRREVESKEVCSTGRKISKKNV